MTIDTIFEIVEDALVAVKFDDEPKNSFEYCFDLWGDIEYLETFFEENRNDLDNKFWRLSIEDAIDQVLNEATQLKKDILFYAREGKYNTDAEMDDNIFKPLAEYNHKNTRVQSKAYGDAKGNSLLRIYAIRLGPNCYVVTGGAIKLTRTMEERKHTEKELQKLRLVSEYLKGHGIDDQEDYCYIEIDEKN